MKKIINLVTMLVTFGFANACKEISNGWYLNFFNTDTFVQGYEYEIRLFGKGYGKEKDVKDAIEKSFSGY